MPRNIRRLNAPHGTGPLRTVVDNSFPITPNTTLLDWIESWLGRGASGCGETIAVADHLGRPTPILLFGRKLPARSSAIAQEMAVLLAAEEGVGLIIDDTSEALAADVKSAPNGNTGLTR